MEKESAPRETDIPNLTTGKPCPVLKASLFSYVTWQWMQPFITTGNRKTLQAEDLFDLVPDECALQCEKKWLKAMEEEKSRKGHGESLSVWKLLFKSMGYKFMLSSLFKPVWLVAMILQVYSLRELVQITRSTEHLRWWWATVLVLGMFLTAMAQSIAQHLCFTIGQRTGVMARSTIAMAVFNKMQEMRLVSLVNTNTGIMLNLVTNDTQKIVDAGMFFHNVWFAVVEVVVVCGFMLHEAGVAAIPGCVLILLTQPLQVVMAQKVGRLRRIAVNYTDIRVRSVNEILNGVRVVKYNGWTAAFLKRIGGLRASELHWIKKSNFLRASTSTLRDGVTPLASLVTFGTYVAIHGGSALTPSLAFTILALFGILVRLFSIAPLGLQYVSESLVAIQRLQQLLDLPNGHGLGTPADEFILTHVGLNFPRRCHFGGQVLAGKAVSVSDATFSWSLKDWYSSDTKKRKWKSGKRKKKKNGKHDNMNGLKILSQVPHRGSQSLRNCKTFEEAATLQGITLEIQRGELVAIVGAVGSGKSSLLLALLGEMECLAGAFATERPVAYAPQQPWISNDTIRSNILFGNKYDEKRYAATVTACALDHDIAQLPAGHDTEIGERGVTLSGGQKARVSLARACYSPHALLLLDDPLAAVDVPTARHLLDHLFAGLLENRTAILVTHNKTSLPYCHRVFLMDRGEMHQVAHVELDGVVLDPPELTAGEETGSGRKARKDDDDSRNNPVVEVIGDASRDAPPSARANGTIGAAGDLDWVEKKGMLVVKEERVEGGVTWGTYTQYVKDGSGLAFCAWLVFIFLFAQAVRVMVDYWLSVWVDRKYHLSTKMYVISYAAFSAGAIALSLSRALLFTQAAMVSAKRMHGRMAERVLRSPQLFFDQNPVGRIVNRFSKDQSLVDEILPSTAQNCVESFVGCLGSMAIIAVLIPWFLVCVPPFVLAFWYVQRQYVTVSRELKRLDGISRSPMYAHLSETLQGIASVRAFGAERVMHDQFAAMVDANHRAFILFVHASRWLGVRLDLAAAVCVTVTSLLVILLRHSISPGLAGVVLVQSLQLTGYFQYCVRLAAETENYFTSVERIQAYSKLPSEADPDSSPGVIPDDWPQRGEIEFVDYTMAYREDLPPVLNDLCFKVEAQEKVGILGRTGAGKSSLAAAMFRLVENKACRGSILIDGVDIAHVGLDDLRRRLSIIPQDPVLFRGTVRLNLDPFEQHSDAEINEAIARVHLSRKIESLDIGIDSIVAENGENFSVGQRQLLCLARSLLRRSRVLVMDEATAAVDGETDQLIQTTMRSVFHTCTVLTIAHRIDTIIDCHRVLVLAPGGRVAEFDTPANLLRRAENLHTQAAAAAAAGSEGCDDLDTASASINGSYLGFADMVAQSGVVMAKQLREAAEAAEFQRRRRSS